MKFYYSKTYADLIDGIHVIQDNVGTHYPAPWNDFDYIVTFNAVYVVDSKIVILGETKILINGQTNTSKYFLEKGIKIDDGKTTEISELLDASNTVSLASDIAYYKAIHTNLSADDAITFLDGICDASYNFENFETYKQWPGFKSALLRQGTTAKARIKKGYPTATGRYAREAKFSIEVDSLSGSFEPLKFNFSSNRELGATNINLLIGENGTGKTHILKHIASLVTGLETSTNSWPYFHKLVVAAFSPFEHFHTSNEVAELLINKYAPQNMISRELSKSKRKRHLKINKYSYIGYKNESGKFQLDWPKEQSAKSLLKIIIDADGTYNTWPKSRFAILKDTLHTAIDFDTLGFKTKDGNHILITEDFLNSPEPFSKSVDLRYGICFFKKGIEISLSSGQLIYTYMLPALAAEIEEESLVILDEPELYLHPSLEVGLITMLQNLLKDTYSYAVIATHSAVLAREIDSNGINILRRSEQGTYSVKPAIETFGGSLDAIVGDVFDDYHETKPYQQIIDSEITNSKDHSELLKKISPMVGDEALAYINSKLYPLPETIVFKER